MADLDAARDELDSLLLELCSFVQLASDGMVVNTNEARSALVRTQHVKTLLGARDHQEVDHG